MDTTTLLIGAGFVTALIGLLGGKAIRLMLVAVVICGAMMMQNNLTDSLTSSWTHVRSQSQTMFGDFR